MGDSGFLGLVSHCYSNHLPLAINPHDIWVIFLSEIAKIIAQSPEEYREHFTDSSAKKLILVPTGSLTEIPMGLLSSKLIENLKFDSKIFLRSFTTNTPFVEEVFQALLCDISSPYYNYGMFACGIPSIQIKGTKEDWADVIQGADDVYEQFKTTRIKYYVSKIIDILSEFVLVFDRPNDDFWKGIFTQNNQGSGGQLFIDGWITKLFAKNHSLKNITNFTNTEGVVKYKNVSTNKEYSVSYGGYDMHETEGFFELVYSKKISEL